MEKTKYVFVFYLYRRRYFYTHNVFRHRRLILENQHYFIFVDNTISVSRSQHNKTYSAFPFSLHVCYDFRCSIHDYQTLMHILITINNWYLVLKIAWEKSCQGLFILFLFLLHWLEIWFVAFIMFVNDIFACNKVPSYSGARHKALQDGMFEDSIHQYLDQIISLRNILIL